MGIFVDNHDNPRFLNLWGNLKQLKGATAFSMIYRGIPIFYYGDEQGFNGATDPYCREPLWTKMNKDS